MNVSFLGLGVMGYPMAGHLARAGHKVTVYNRVVQKPRMANEFGGALAATPRGSHWTRDRICLRR